MVGRYCLKSLDQPPSPLEDSPTEVANNSDDEQPKVPWDTGYRRSGGFSIGSIDYRLAGRT